MKRTLKVAHTFKITERLDNSRGGSSNAKDLPAGKAITD